MKIFISYRRDDSSGYAGRLFDHLTAHFGAQSVFMDIDTIRPGEDFRKAIREAVGSCDVALVMIGRDWSSARDDQGQRRLDDPGDWVRTEIATALADPTVRVIPVLIRDASMPRVNELPDDLKELAYRNAHELSDNRFAYDANRLIEVIKSLGIEPVAAAVPPPGTKPQLSAAKLGGAVLGLVGLALLFVLIRSAMAPAAEPDVSTETVTVPEATYTAPAPTEEIPTETATQIPISPAVQTIDQYFTYINEAGVDDDLRQAWDLLTPKFQCSSSKCDYNDFRNFWWKNQVQYELYDCGASKVAAKVVYYARNSTPTAKPFYLNLELLEEDGQLKINGASTDTGISSSCELVPSLP
jgi:hypothetical protein